MKYCALVCSLFMVACSPQLKIYSDYNSDGFIITSLKGSKIRLYVNPKIDIREFKKTFENEYRCQSIFDSVVTLRLKDKLGKYATVNIDTNSNMDNLFVNQSFSDDNIARVKRIFEQANDDYILGIKRVVISNSVIQDQPTRLGSSVVRTPDGKTVIHDEMIEGKKNEDCVIRIISEIWSVKERKKVSEFTSIGQSTVSLLMYSKALNNALEYSINHLSNYIEENKLN